MDYGSPGAGAGVRASATDAGTAAAELHGQGESLFVRVCGFRSLGFRASMRWRIKLLHDPVYLNPLAL